MNTPVELEASQKTADRVRKFRLPVRSILAALQTNWALLAMGLALTALLSIYLVWVLFSRLAAFQMVVLIACISFFPLTYLAYQLRSEKHKARLVVDFSLLGFLKDEQERQVVEEQYQRIHSPQQYLIYVSLASLVTLLGFGLLHFNPTLLEGYLGPQPERIALTMFFAFLGAYVFSISHVFRRFITYDLQPGVYLNVVVRMLTVMVLGILLALASESTFPGLFPASALPVQEILPLAAFAIGYLPDLGIRWVLSAASRLLGNLNLTENSLGSINGISIWHETRLRESGIDNTQNLEACDVRELLLSSRFSAQQLMNWIDQAILVTNVSSDLLRELNHHGIQNITTLRMIVAARGFEGLPDLPPQVLFKDAQKPPAPSGSPTDSSASAPHDDVSPTCLLKFYQALYYAAETSPNFYYVMEYWRAVKIFRENELRSSLDLTLQNRGIQIFNYVQFDPEQLEQMGRAWTSLGLPAAILPKLFPTTTEGQIALASLYIQLESYTLAISTLTAVISQDPGSAAAYASRGLAHARLKKYAEAFADFAAAREIAPNYALTYRHMGAVHLVLKQYQQAVSVLTTAVQKDPSSAVAFFTLGRAYASLEQYDKALDAFTRSIQIKPLASAYLERGVIYTSQGSLRQALEDYTKAVELDHGSALAYARRGMIHLVLQDYSSARYDLNTALLHAPDLAEAYVNRGMLHFQLQDEESAIDDYTLALLYDPKLVDTYLYRGLAYHKTGDALQARQDLQTYLDLAPQAPKAAEVRQILADLEPV
jgi:tetratricopeptide (TPR) repeat protein